MLFYQRGKLWQGEIEPLCPLSGLAVSLFCRVYGRPRAKGHSVANASGCQNFFRGEKRWGREKLTGGNGEESAKRETASVILQRFASSLGVFSPIVGCLCRYCVKGGIHTSTSFFYGVFSSSSLFLFRFPLVAKWLDFLVLLQTLSNLSIGVETWQNLSYPFLLYNQHCQKVRLTSYLGKGDYFCLTW